MQMPRRLVLRVFTAVLMIGATQTALGAGSAHAADRPVTAQRVTSLGACPVGGASEYIDSWGDARSGGRRHEGVDMTGQRGTPVLAVRGGDAEFKRSNLGGNAIWLVTPAGERFYYAHLDAWEGTSRTVSAGEVIGYVGSTGNARGDHLHFETRVSDEAFNPYPLVSQACAPRPVVVPSPRPVTRMLPR